MAIRAETCSWDIFYISDNIVVFKTVNPSTISYLRYHPTTHSLHSSLVDPKAIQTTAPKICTEKLYSMFCRSRNRPRKGCSVLYIRKKKRKSKLKLNELCSTCTNVMLLTHQIGLLEPTVITTTTTTTKIHDPQSTRGPRRIHQIKSCSEVCSSNRSSR